MEQARFYWVRLSQCGGRGGGTTAVEERTIVLVLKGEELGGVLEWVDMRVCAR